MATAKIEEREGIVLSRIPQKEHDAMVRCLGKDGFFSFYSRGALKVGSSSAFCTQELARSAFNLVVSASDALTLREGRLRRLYGPSGGLTGMLVAQLLLEFCLKALPEEDGAAYFPVLDGALSALENGNDPYSVAIMALAHGANLSGYGLEVDHCVICGGTSHIAAMDASQGGYVCEECLAVNGSLPCSLDELKIYRHAFRCPLSDFARVRYPAEAVEAVVLTLLRHIEEQTTVLLKALQPILH